MKVVCAGGAFAGEGSSPAANGDEAVACENGQGCEEQGVEGKTRPDGVEWDALLAFGSLTAEPGAPLDGEFLEREAAGESTDFCGNRLG